MMLRHFCSGFTIHAVKNLPSLFLQPSDPQGRQRALSSNIGIDLGKKFAQFRLEPAGTFAEGRVRGVSGYYENRSQQRRLSGTPVSGPCSGLRPTATKQFCNLITILVNWLSFDPRQFAVFQGRLSNEIVYR
jgi:hypothetical protein